MEAAALTNAALRLFFFSSRRRHTRWPRDWSSDVCSSDLHKKFLASLVRQQGWSVGDALDFQKDLQLYEDLLARTAPARRSPKPFEAANHPFVDRCAFLLDSSFLEKARMAASCALAELENLAVQVCEASGYSNKPVWMN